MLTTYAYFAYLALSIAITVWVGRSLHTNGRIFHIENFRGNAALADSVNHLLLVGFYLINFGFITLALKFGDKPQNIQETVEFFSTKVGLAIMVLGVMHFYNMHLLVRYRHLAVKMLGLPEAAKEEAVHA